MTQKTILITGCSTGIGYTCAHGLKQRGYRVLATARSEADLKRLESEGLEAIALDYRFPESVEACVSEVMKRTGGSLYALFNNGAYGQPGAVEDVPRAVLEEQFAANFFGWHQLTRAVLPMMRKAGEGRIGQGIPFQRQPRAGHEEAPLVREMRIERVALHARFQSC